MGDVDRAEKRLRMSRNCSEKLEDTRGFCYSFAIELLLRGPASRPIFGKISSMKLLCSKDSLYPCYRTVCSESSKLSCSTYVLARAENLVALQITFQKFRHFPIVLIWFRCVSSRKFGTGGDVLIFSSIGYVSSDDEKT